MSAKVLASIVIPLAIGGIILIASVEKVVAIWGGWVLCVLAVIITVIWLITLKRGKSPEQFKEKRLILQEAEIDGQTVNETKALDWVTCDKCGFIGVRNIKTRELEEMEDNQRRTGQPILTRINSLGDTEPRHEKIPECIMQAEDFATLPPLSSQPLPLFYMQLPRQCPKFIKWQKGLSPKEHKEGSAIPDMLKSPRPPELQISYQKHEFGVFNGETIITVFAEYRPTGTMRIEAIELRLVGERKPSLDWEVYEVKQDVWITSDNKFKVPDGISPGKHDVTLAAYANGEWWGSHPFTIAFPEVND